MEIKRTTEFFIELNRRFRISQPAAPENVFCAECGSPMFAAEQLADLFNVSRRRVYQFVETNAAHFAETEAGVLLVCPNSLAKHFTNLTEEKFL